MLKKNKIPTVEDQALLTPANKLSKLIKEGSLSAVKLCQLYVDRINQVQPFTNAMAQDRFRDALEDARQIDQMLNEFRSGKPESDFSPDQVEMLRSPLLGVPISVKESIQVKGMRNSCGIWHRREVNATTDAVVVANIRRQGLIPICTTNVPECTLYWADCNNKVYGRTRNPYDSSRVPGASSGGEGALLGAGASVVGIGSDLAGSLRYPAQYCGIFSHKPSPFLISPEGNYPEVLESRLRMFTIGPMCRYASDLKPMLKCLMSDKDNLKQDTYFKFQPEDIGQARAELMQKLDGPVDLSKIKIFYFNFNEASKLKGFSSLHVQQEFMDAQQEVLDHFQSKFNCQLEHLNLDKFFEESTMMRRCMISGAGAIDAESNFNVNELDELMGLGNHFWEFMKLPLGLSNHTKEAMLAMAVELGFAKDQKKAKVICEKYEKLAAELKSEINSILGDNGVLIMPTVPSTAHKHNVSLVKVPDIRFPSIFNIFQLPVTHATMRTDKKNNLPFGFSLASRPFNDHLTIGMAEEIELTFGGWRDPGALKALESAAKEQKKSSKASKSTNDNLPQQVADQQVPKEQVAVQVN